MKRLDNLFHHKKKNILNIYCTAGYPALDSTMPVIQALHESGVDIVELGIPYSDPLADGATIQNSSTTALNNGMTIGQLFEQLQPLRKSIAEGGVGDVMPVVLMGYMNPVLQYGFEKFCAAAASVGIDGLILPDMPAHEFEKTYAAIFKKHQLNCIFLVTPETPEARVRYLDALSSGFLYAVSSSSTTGNEKDFSLVEKYLQRLQSYHLKNPVLVGFGIKDQETFANACKNANGAIIGSAYVKAIQNHNALHATTRSFVKNICS